MYKRNKFENSYLDNAETRLHLCLTKYVFTCTFNTPAFPASSQDDSYLVTTKAGNLCFTEHRSSLC